MASTRVMVSMAVDTVAEIVHDYKLTTIEVRTLLGHLAGVAVAAETGASGAHVSALKMELYAMADDMTDNGRSRRR